MPEEFDPALDEVVEPKPKAKTKHDLELEIEALKAEIAELKTNKVVGPKEGHQFVFVKSEWVAATTHPDKSKTIKVSINGIETDVPCDKQVEVPDDVAEVLIGVAKANS